MKDENDKQRNQSILIMISYFDTRIVILWRGLYRLHRTQRSMGTNFIDRQSMKRNVKTDVMPLCNLSNVVVILSAPHFCSRFNIHRI